MTPLCCLAVCLAFSIVFASSTQLSTYIIETHPETKLDGLKWTLQAQDDLSCLGRFNLKLGREFDSDIFRGMSVSTASTDVDSAMACLRSITGVSKVWLSSKYRLQSSSSSDARNWTELNASIDSSIVHRMTGVDRLQKQGITGEGATIAILDSGVDYLHRALGGGLGLGHKITYGRDLTGDNFSSSTPPSPDNDPYSECYFHGTHVTGIAVGEDPTIGFVGVAPGAKVEYFRITGCNEYVESTIVMSAILQAYERHVDVISASLSLDTGPFADDPVSALFTRITEQGRIVCVVAAANQGRNGTFSAGAPASGSNVLSVGYVNADYLIQSRPRALFKTGNGSTRDFLWAPATPGRFPEQAKLASLSLNASASDEACHPVARRPDNGSDSVLVVRRGGCSFDAKMRNIYNAGWKYMLAYNNDQSGLFDFDIKFQGILGAGALSADEGETFVNLLASGNEIEVFMDSNFTLIPSLSTRANTLPGGAMNSRSSWGPTGDAGIFPSLVAPGGGIFSSFPRSWGGYGVLSGTSMAAPYVAGAVALIKQARPSLSSAEIIRLLVSTARPLLFNDGSNVTYDFLAPVWHQGGGMINVFDAVHSQTLPQISSIAFNDTDHLHGQIHLQVHNTGESALTYTVLQRSAISVLPFAQNASSPIPWTTNETALVASPEFLGTLQPETVAEIEVVPKQLALQPGQSATVTASLRYPTLSSDLDSCSLYGGYVMLQHGNQTALSIPYGGIGCSLKDIRAIPNGWRGVFLGAMTLEQSDTRGSKPTQVAPNTTFTIPNPESSLTNKSIILFPTVSVGLAMFTRAMAIYLVPNVHSSTNATQSLAFHLETTAQPGGFSRVERYNFAWEGRIGDGSRVEEGEYRFRVCALEAWADLKVLRDSIDCTTTELFVLKYS